MSVDPSSRAHAEAPAARAHRRFTLILGGDGATGLAGAGALRALEHAGYRPGTVIGVSVGALVAAAYALNPGWYRALLSLDPRCLSATLAGAEGSLLATDRSGPAASSPAPWPAAPSTGAAAAGSTAPGGHGEPRTTSSDEQALRRQRAMLGAAHRLTRGDRLEHARIPALLVATDLRTASRVVLDRGPAAEAVYASVARAGSLPPLRRGGSLLADGAYADPAPVDLARQQGHPIVLAVDAGGNHGTSDPGNGLQATLRAMEICHRNFTSVRLARADLVLRPRGPLTPSGGEPPSLREIVAAGERAVLNVRSALQALLAPQRAAPGAPLRWLEPSASHPRVARDPVCGAHLDPSAVELRAEYRGVLYAFCSSDCKRSFDADPERYAWHGPAEAALDRRGPST